MNDLMHPYHRELQDELTRQAATGALRRQVLVQRRARRRLAKAERTALRARLVLAAGDVPLRAVPQQRQP